MGHYHYCTVVFYLFNLDILRCFCLEFFYYWQIPLALTIAYTSDMNANQHSKGNICPLANVSTFSLYLVSPVTFYHFHFLTSLFGTLLKTKNTPIWRNPGQLFSPSIPFKVHMHAIKSNPGPASLSPISHG